MRLKSKLVNHFLNRLNIYLIQYLLFDAYSCIN